MKLRTTTPRTCEICSSETKSDEHEFCPTCERRIEMIFQEMATEGVAVMVPYRVN